MENQKRRWKGLLGYGFFLLALGLLLYYYREAYEGIHDGWHFFSSKERLNHFIASFGPYAPHSLHWVTDPADPGGPDTR